MTVWPFIAAEVEVMINIVPLDTSQLTLHTGSLLPEVIYEVFAMLLDDIVDDGPPRMGRLLRTVDLIPGKVLNPLTNRSFIHANVPRRCTFAPEHPV